MGNYRIYPAMGEHCNGKEVGYLREERRFAL